MSHYLNRDLITGPNENYELSSDYNEKFQNFDYENISEQDFVQKLDKLLNLNHLKEIKPNQIVRLKSFEM